MEIVLGHCTACGNQQPGNKDDARVTPLAENGCAKCESEEFAVGEE